jgi:predicted O-methyltransferase YrrM
VTDTVTMTVSVVTVADITVPRWMSPFVKHLFGIPTHMTMQERTVLLNTAMALPPGFSIVEIGSYLGASTAFLGFAALQRAGYVHAIDPWTNDAMGAEGERDTFSEFRANTAPFEHFIVPHRGTSVEVHHQGPIPCDMLLIDGDHSYPAVVADLRTWLPDLKPGGILAMHDIDAASVRRAFDEVVGERVQSPPQITDRLLICRPNAPV